MKTQSVVLIDYGSGNLRSAAKAFARAATELNLKNIEIKVSANVDDIRRADRLVLPGVGAFADCKAGVEGIEGLPQILNERIVQQGQPFFGICVGMQLMASVGKEHGTHRGFNWIEGEVVPLAPTDPSLKIPHMGWNEIVVTATDHPLLQGIAPKTHGYFVHSYQFSCAQPEHVLAQVHYGGAVVAAVGRDNLFGTQFHPEKSQKFGLDLIGRFLQWKV